MAGYDDETIIKLETNESPFRLHLEGSVSASQKKRFEDALSSNTSTKQLVLKEADTTTVTMVCKVLRETRKDLLVLGLENLSEDAVKVLQILGTVRGLILVNLSVVSVKALQLPGTVTELRLENLSEASVNALQRPLTVTVFSLENLSAASVKEVQIPLTVTVLRLANLSVDSIKEVQIPERMKGLVLENLSVASVKALQIPATGRALRLVKLSTEAVLSVLSKVAGNISLELRGLTSDTLDEALTCLTANRKPGMKVKCDNAEFQLAFNNITQLPSREEQQQGQELQNLPQAASSEASALSRGIKRKTDVTSTPPEEDSRRVRGRTDASASQPQSFFSSSPSQGNAANTPPEYNNRL